MSLLSQASLVMTPNAIKESKIYSIIPTNGNGDADFTRGTLASSTLSGVNGLIETVPYNLLTYSEQFDNVTFWQTQIGGTGVNPIRTANTAVSPNGTLTADTIIFNRGVGNTITDQTSITQNPTISPLTDYTLSLWVKASTVGDVGKQIYIRCGGNGALIAFTLTINWVRIQVSTNITVSGSCFIGNRGTVTADNVVSVDLWGAQLVQGSVPKDYFFTTDRLNVPRLNYDSVGGCPSLLLEPQRMNLVTNSEDFSAANWIPTTATITTNADISPSGVQNADRLTAIAPFSQIQATPTVVSGSTYTVSIWIKRISGTGQVNIRAIENVNTPITITNQWVRYSVTATASTTIGRIGVNLVTSGDVVAIWGAQLEQGAYPTSYIPTTTTALTRNADVFTRNNIYTNGLITSAGGTWFVELNNALSLIRDNSGFSLFISTIAGGSGGDGFLFYNPVPTSTRLQIIKYVSGSATAIYTLPSDIVKLAIKWDTSNANIFANGSKVVNSSAFTGFNMQYLSTGTLGVSTYIKSMFLFPTPLTDTECIALTQ